MIKVQFFLVMLKISPEKYDYYFLNHLIFLSALLSFLRVKVVSSEGLFKYGNFGILVDKI